jgi:NTE family protein
MFVSDREVLRMDFIRSSEENEAPLLPSELRHEPLPRQVVTLAFLSGQIPAPRISEQLARSLCAETEASVVLVRLEPQNGIGSTNGEARPEFFLNGEFHLPPEMRPTDGGFHSIILGVQSDPPTPAGIASLVSRLSRRFRYVLIEALVNKSPAPWFSELLLRSNLAYLFLKPTNGAVDHLDLVMREARARCRNGGVHVKPVACLAEGEQIDGFDLLGQSVTSPMHMFVHGCPTLERAKDAGLQTSPTDLFRADVRRLAREIGGCLVGLALSSGAAKGFAHIGVIQVLEENGIEVDVIAGASMGAYVGSLWAYGCDGRELERLARELETRWALWTLIDPAFPPRRGFIRGFAVKKRLMRTIGNVHFADLVRPLRIVAANLATLERVVFSSGEVAAAVHASTAVPGICVPITIDGAIYSDGGIVDPLPVDVLREMGVSKVIAVNVIPTPERIRQGIEAELEQARQNETKGRRLFSKGSPLNRQVNYFARGNVLEILMRSVHGAQIRMAEASCQMADLVLRPDIFDDCWLDYRSPGRFIALGREAAERHLEEIKSLVTRKEMIHERKLAPESVAAVI